MSTELKAGDEYYLSDWLELDREHLEQFAWSTYLDPEHVDLSVSKNNPMGADLVDGFWQVSMLLYFSFKYGRRSSADEYGFNYGLNKVRFIAPLMLGQRVRVRSVVVDIADHPAGRLVTTRNTMEIEFQDKPSMVADLVLLSITPDLKEPE